MNDKVTLVYLTLEELEFRIDRLRLSDRPMFLRSSLGLSQEGIYLKYVEKSPVDFDASLKYLR